MRRSLLALALAGLLLSACGDDSGDVGSAVPSSSASTGSPESTGSSGSSGSSGSTTPDTGGQGTPTVPEALQFRAPVVGGGELDMSTFAGQTVAFWFWAPT